MRRQLAALVLLPVLLIGSASHAWAGGKTPSQPGLTIHKVGIVKYQIDSWDAEEGLFRDHGIVPITYTCRAGGDWGQAVAVDLDLSADRFAAMTERFGDVLLCDGTRRTLDAWVDRRVDIPFTPSARIVPGELRIHVTSCAACSDRVDLASWTEPIKLQFRGDWPEGPWQDR